MTSHNTDVVNSRKFLIRAEDALGRLDVSGDRRVVPTIAVSFCDLLHESLAASQKMALAAAWYLLDGIVQRFFMSFSRG